MSGLISKATSFLFPMPQSKIGVLTIDALVTENIKLPSEVTKYPVEDGSEEISDHITANNEELTITASVASGTAYGFELGSCKSKLINAVDQLRQMHKDRKTITIVTGLGQYKDMAFTNLTINRSNSDRGGGWLDVNADLRKIKKVTLKTADLPADKAATGPGGADGKTGKSEARTSKSGTSSQTPGGSAALNGAETLRDKTGFSGAIGPQPSS
jgi:hypothetical protein